MKIEYRAKDHPESQLLRPLADIYTTLQCIIGFWFLYYSLIALLEISRSFF